MILCFPLSRFAWNDVIKSPLYTLPFSPLMTSKALLPKIQIAFSGLTLLWLAVTLVRLSLYLHASHKLSRSFRFLEFYDDYDGLFRESALAVGIRPEKVRVLISNQITTPLSFGIVKKIILLPRDIQEKYSKNELNMLFIHEAMHIKHGDTWKLHLIRIAECFLWLSPAVLRFEKKFRQDSEVFCDNQVIYIRQCQRDNYGELLVKACSGGPSDSLGFGLSQAFQALEYRIEALYRYVPVKSRPSVFSVAVFVAAVVLLGYAPYTLLERPVINSAANGGFEIQLSYVPAIEEIDDLAYPPLSLKADDCPGLYEIEGEEIFFDLYVLREIAEKYKGTGYTDIDIMMAPVNKSDEPEQHSPIVTYSFSELENIDESLRFYDLPFFPNQREAGVLLQVVCNPILNLPPIDLSLDEYSGLYEVKGNQFLLDKDIAHEIYMEYGLMGYTDLDFIYKVYSVNSTRYEAEGSVMISSSKHVSFLLSEFEDIDVNDRYATRPIKNKDMYDYVFLLLAYLL